MKLSKKMSFIALPACRSLVSRLRGNDTSCTRRHSRAGGSPGGFLLSFVDNHFIKRIVWPGLVVNVKRL